MNKHILSVMKTIKRPFLSFVNIFHLYVLPFTADFGSFQNSFTILIGLQRCETRHLEAVTDKHAVNRTCLRLQLVHCRRVQSAQYILTAVVVRAITLSDVALYGALYDVGFHLLSKPVGIKRVIDIKYFV